MQNKYKILLIDDEEDFRFTMSLNLQNSGFDVVPAKGGDHGLEIMKSTKPDLVLLDLNMPNPDGHEVCEIIRKDPTLCAIPVIILTSSDELSDKLKRLEGGADDYVTKYTDYKELEARMKMVIQRNLQSLDSNPLTRLPGNNIIQEKIKTYINNKTPFSVAYTDLDNFKAYNDIYGFKKGDDVILFSAKVMKESVKNNGNGNEFIGHIGGDDFVVIAQPQTIKKICDGIVKLVDEGIVEFYEDEDRREGYITTKDRQGVIRKFPLVSISIAIVNDSLNNFTNIGEIIRTVTELKSLAKKTTGSIVVVDKRNP